MSRLKIKKEISAGGIVYLPAGRQVKSKIQNPKSKKDDVLWLITKHSAFGHWSFPKGLIGDVHKNEKMEEAALREVREEGGVKAEIVNDKPITVKYNYKWKGTLIKKTVHYYLMKYISGDPKDHDWEVSEAKFVGESEVKKLLTFENDKKAFEEAIRLLNG
jgi:ADP-ribose pyrophosphatase YjhB (NUDIX family)